MPEDGDDLSPADGDGANFPEVMAGITIPAQASGPASVRTAAVSLDSGMYRCCCRCMSLGRRPNRYGATSGANGVTIGARPGGGRWRFSFGQVTVRASRAVGMAPGCERVDDDP